MTSQDSTHDIEAIISHLTSIICESTFTVSLSSHPDYRSYNRQCIYDNRATIYIISYELHMTSHPLFMISHHAMTSHPPYSCHHTQDTCHRFHCSWTITNSVLIIPHLLYVWHETHCMYDTIWNLYDIPLTLYDITILYSGRHIHSIHDSTPPHMISHTRYLWHHTTVSMTRHLLCLWHQPQYMWHLTWCMNDNTTTVSDITLTVSV